MRARRTVPGPQHVLRKCGCCVSGERVRRQPSLLNKSQDRDHSNDNSGGLVSPYCFNTASDLTHATSPQGAVLSNFTVKEMETQRGYASCLKTPS